jgi:endonuclease/exonuclease/phosphatase family metal-dependent hydrolase
MQWRDGRWSPSPRQTPSAPVPLRIATWNAWLSDYRSHTRFHALLAELQQRNLDVIALQEVTQELLDRILAAPWIRSEYQVSEPEVIGYDVILLSRLPIRRMATIRLPGTMGRRLVVAELACGLEVATVHLESAARAARDHLRIPRESWRRAARR